MYLWAHTIAVLKQAYPAFDEQAVLSHAVEDISGDSLIAAFVNGVHRVSQRTVLLWDDFHHFHHNQRAIDLRESGLFTGALAIPRSSPYRKPNSPVAFSIQNKDRERVEPIGCE